LGRYTDWRAALDGVTAVVHLAGPAHVATRPDDLRKAIVEGTAALVAQAQSAGVKRFIYVSSIRACAAQSAAALTERAQPCPAEPYGRAKLEAERIVLDRHGMGPVVIRPPFVVGPKPKGNLAALLRLLDTPAPLPFGGLKNKRNVVSLVSLTRAIETLLAPEHASAAGVFHIADHPALSTSEIATLLRQGMGRAPRLFALPGFELLAPRPLVESLMIDDSRLRSAIGFKGEDSREALLGCAQAWKGRR
jgi:UDP-glucose 4-epimerase